MTNRRRDHVYDPEETERLVQGVDDVYFGDGPSFEAEKVYEEVWRFDFTAPGFCLLDAGPGVDSHALRSWWWT